MQTGINSPLHTTELRIDIPGTVVIIIVYGVILASLGITYEVCSLVIKGSGNTPYPSVTMLPLFITI